MKRVLDYAAPPPTATQRMPRYVIMQVVGIVAGLFSLLAMLCGACILLFAFEEAIERGFVFPPFFVGGSFFGAGVFGAWKSIKGVFARI